MLFWSYWNGPEGHNETQKNIYGVKLTSKSKKQFLDFSNEFTNCNAVGMPVEHLWYVFWDKLLNLLDPFVPFKMVGANCKQSWVNRIITQLGRKKQRCYNHAKTDKQWQYTISA